MKKEYYTPITELDFDSECEEIVKGYKKITEEINRCSQELDRKRAGIDEEDYYQGEFLEMEIELRELQEELSNIAQLLIDKRCSGFSPEFEREIEEKAKKKIFLF